MKFSLTRNLDTAGYAVNIELTGGDILEADTEFAKQGRKLEMLPDKGKLSLILKNITRIVTGLEEARERADQESELACKKDGNCSACNPVIAEVAEELGKHLDSPESEEGLEEDNSLCSKTPKIQ